jgi:adenosine deaminase CECR1
MTFLTAQRLTPLLSFTLLSLTIPPSYAVPPSPTPISQQITPTINLKNLRQNPRLREILTKMPKGGELHSHLAGLHTPEELLQLASKSQNYNYFIQVPINYNPLDPQAYSFVAFKKNNPLPKNFQYKLVPISELINPQTFAQKQLLETFRKAQTLSPNDPQAKNIFYSASFSRREAVTDNLELLSESVKIALENAQKNQVSYIELMLSPFLVGLDATAEEQEKALNINTVKNNLAMMIKAVEEFNQSLPEEQKIEVRFMLSSRRTSTKMFTQLPILFQIASEPDKIGKYIAGINLVGDEYSDDKIIGQAIADPSKIDDYIMTLRRIYPTVRLSIHAGETTQWDWHIRDSLLMGAERIGHGVNLANSPVKNPPEAILMKRQNDMIEICLTSNHLLLGIPLNKHPFLKYLRSGIPISLNTDDAGIFNTNMTEEFARMIENYPDLTWEEVKQIAKASLEHAFIDDEGKQRLLKRWEKEMKTFELSL